MPQVGQEFLPHLLVEGARVQGHQSKSVFKETILQMMEILFQIRV